MRDINNAPLSQATGHWANPQGRIHSQIRRTKIGPRACFYSSWLGMRDINNAPLSQATGHWANPQRRIHSQIRRTKIGPRACFYSSWLGMRDSNPRMVGPEPTALPLGESPTVLSILIQFTQKSKSPDAKGRGCQLEATDMQAEIDNLRLGQIGRPMVFVGVD